ncbi:unnamed protein product [Fraxinus pennsylvanica]|uniref:Uncharacterized protein n=1 Tax=Fraxinus pennsylvanica TaxID=56036 RepID=A0AAD1YL38_9LAMI|nr:unnamed protein product [Fraxinus pennsylvanica]
MRRYQSRHGRRRLFRERRRLDPFFATLLCLLSLRLSDPLVTASFTAGRRYLNPEPRTSLAEVDQQMAPQFENLNKSLIELLETLAAKIHGMICEFFCVIVSSEKGTSKNKETDDPVHEKAVLENLMDLLLTKKMCSINFLFPKLPKT